MRHGLRLAVDSIECSSHHTAFLAGSAVLSDLRSGKSRYAGPNLGTLRLLGTLLNPQGCTLKPPKMVRPFLPVKQSWMHSVGLALGNLLYRTAT